MDETQTKSCPKCGKRNDHDAIECQRCGIIFEKYEQIQKRKAQEAKQQEAKDIKITPPKEEYNTPIHKRHKKLVNTIIVSSIIVVLAISFIGYRIDLKMEADKAQAQAEKAQAQAEKAKAQAEAKEKIEAEKAQAHAEFSTFMKRISTRMVILAATSESVVDETNRKWREAIFSKHNKRDFNEAIMEVHTKRINTILSIKKLSDDIAQSIKNITPPPVMERDYNRLKELYLLFNKYADMAISPSGSLQTYSNQNNALSVEIKSAVKELEMMK